MAVLLWGAAALPADPPSLDIPAEVRPAGQYCLLIPKTDGVSVTYVGLDRVDPLPSVLLKDPRQFVLDSRGLAPGRYRFAAVAAGATGEQSRADFAVVIGDPPPVPPGPNPPGPTPPVDPLVKAFQAAADQTPGEKTGVTALRDVMSQTATDITAGKYADNAALAAAVKAATDAKVGAGRLTPLRAAVGKHLNETLPTAVTPLADAATRETFRTAYARVAAALGEIR